MASEFQQYINCSPSESLEGHTDHNLSGLESGFYWPILDLAQDKVCDLENFI